MLILGKNNNFSTKNQPKFGKVLFFKSEGARTPLFDAGQTTQKESSSAGKTKEELADLSFEHLLSMAEEAEQIGDSAQYAAPKNLGETAEALSKMHLHEQIVAEEKRATEQARIDLEKAAQDKDDRLTGRHEASVIIDPTYERDVQKAEQKALTKTENQFFLAGNRGNYNEKAVNQYQTEEADDIWNQSVQPVTKKIGRFFSKLFSRRR